MLNSGICLKLLAEISGGTADGIAFSRISADSA